MLLKSADSKDDLLAQLENLLANAPEDKRSKVKSELYALRAGIKGENEATYLINFDFEKRDNWVVLHDLRLEVQGRVAQIDHLLINRFLGCYVLESKHFNSGLKITEEGEFLRWSGYKKTYEGMPSPLAQNERHISVLRDAFETLKMPERLGIKLKPSFHSFVLVSANARVDRPNSFDTSKVIKADVLKATIDKDIDNWGALKLLGNAAKLVDQATIYAIGRRLASMHVPFSINYAERFGIEQAMQVPAAGPQPETAPVAGGPTCKHCGVTDGSILYGKYGYYFKCSGCDGNTSVRGHCGVSGHEARIRKEGLRFFNECEACGSSSLYFTNPEPQKAST